MEITHLDSPHPLELTFEKKAEQKSFSARKCYSKSKKVSKRWRADETQVSMYVLWLFGILNLNLAEFLGHTTTIKHGMFRIFNFKTCMSRHLLLSVMLQIWNKLFMSIDEDLKKRVRGFAATKRRFEDRPNFSSSFQGPI